jgi:hypothetical protein
LAEQFDGIRHDVTVPAVIADAAVVTEGFGVVVVVGFGLAGVVLIVACGVVVVGVIVVPTAAFGVDLIGAVAVAGVVALLGTVMGVGALATVDGVVVATGTTRCRTAGAVVAFLATALAGAATDGPAVRSSSAVKLVTLTTTSARPSASAFRHSAR